VVAIRHLYWLSVLLNNIRVLFYLIVVTLSTPVYSHDMTPTYPTFKQSFMVGISVTTLEIFNKRKDVSYYEIGVFTDEWEPIPFVSQYTVIPMRYLDTVSFDVYVSQLSLDSVEYICSVSQLQYGTTVSSKICSRVK